MDNRDDSESDEAMAEDGKRQIYSTKKSKCISVGSDCDKSDEGIHNTRESILTEVSRRGI